MPVCHNSALQCVLNEPLLCNYFVCCWATVALLLTICIGIRYYILTVASGSSGRGEGKTWMGPLYWQIQRGWGGGAPGPYIPSHWPTFWLASPPLRLVVPSRKFWIRRCLICLRLGMGGLRLKTGKMMKSQRGWGGGVVVQVLFLGP